MENVSYYLKRLWKLFQTRIAFNKILLLSRNEVKYLRKRKLLRVASHERFIIFFLLINVLKTVNRFFQVLLFPFDAIFFQPCSIKAVFGFANISSLRKFKKLRHIFKIFIWVTYVQNFHKTLWSILYLELIEIFDFSDIWPG